MDSPTDHGMASPPYNVHSTTTEHSVPATETTAQLTATPVRDAPVNPQVVELRAMFPDFDDTLLYVARYSFAYLAHRHTGSQSWILFTAIKVAPSTRCSA